MCVGDQFRNGDLKCETFLQGELLHIDALEGPHCRSSHSLEASSFLIYNISTVSVRLGSLVVVLALLSFYVGSTVPSDR